MVHNGSDTYKVVSSIIITAASIDIVAKIAALEVA